MPNFIDLIDIIEDSVEGFNKKLPSIQKGILKEVLVQVKGFKLDRKGKIVNSVRNIRLLNTIRNRLRRVILTPEYKEAVKEYMKVFTEIGDFQKAYFKEVETKFKPPEIINEIKKQTISETVTKLTEAGIGVGVSDKISDLLRQNITTGTSYADLAEQLREHIIKTDTDGSLQKYAKQIVTDAANQYSAQYMNTVSGDLGYEWFRYGGRDILTTRPFCDAMTDLQYFHISQVPGLLAAKDLYYVKNGQRTKVPLNPKTELPSGMIEGTNVENFFVRRGGYKCGHQIFPVPEKLVPKEIREKVKK